jgi:hypothetical protein
MSSPQPPINPYESPQAEGSPNNELRESWISPFRQRIGLAWTWTMLGLLTIVLGSLIFSFSLVAIVPWLLGLGWLIAGIGTFFRLVPWSNLGIGVDYLAMATVVGVGFALLIIPDESALITCLITQLFHVVPLTLNAQARRAQQSAQSTISPQ